MRNRKLNCYCLTGIITNPELVGWGGYSLLRVTIRYKNGILQQVLQSPETPDSQ